MKIQSDLKLLAHLFKGSVDTNAFVKIDKLIREDNYQLNHCTEDSRIFPFSIAPAIISTIEDQTPSRKILPMRYRVRPHDSKEEVPNNYNLYNARLDALTSRKTWKGLFGKNHALIPFRQFYEWTAPPQRKKQLVSFYPENRDIMWAPALYDYYKINENEGFYSFALITDDPPLEIERAYHDRCPIFLKSELIDDWLNPASLTEQDFLLLLKKKEEVTYLNAPYQMPQKKSPQLNLFED